MAGAKVSRPEDAYIKSCRDHLRSDDPWPATPHNKPSCRVLTTGIKSKHTFGEKGSADTSKRSVHAETFQTWATRSFSCLLVEEPPDFDGFFQCALVVSTPGTTARQQVSGHAGSLGFRLFQPILMILRFAVRDLDIVSS